MKVEFYQLLTLLFVALKLTGYIQWSWWWVLSPVWMQIVILLVVVIYRLIVELLKK
jgi:hypothetical protein